jgi:hypothetical protein
MKYAVDMGYGAMIYSYFSFLKNIGLGIQKLIEADAKMVW